MNSNKIAQSLTKTLNDSNLEIGLRLNHALYGFGTVIGWRYNDYHNRSPGGGLRVGDTSGGLCSRGYVRILFDDVNKGKWNVPFTDCQIVGLAPLEVACYSLQWYDNSIDSLFQDVTSSATDGIRPTNCSDCNSPSSHNFRSKSPKGSSPGARSRRSAGSPPGSPERERQQKRRLLRKTQRVCSWGDFLARPHHKAFALCKAKERFIWGISFGCQTQVSFIR